MSVMTPELLAMLSTEQREVWERCQKATPGPWLQAKDEAQAGGWWGAVPRNYPGCVVVAINGGECSGETPGHVCCTNDDGIATEREVADSEFIAHARLDLPDALLQLAQAKHALAELRAAVADAPHDMWCAVTFPAAPADLMVCNCWKSETK